MVASPCSPPRASSPRPRRSGPRWPGCSTMASRPARSRSSCATPLPGGPLYRRVLSRFEIPVAVQADLDVSRTVTGPGFWPSSKPRWGGAERRTCSPICEHREWRRPAGWTGSSGSSSAAGCEAPTRPAAWRRDGNEGRNGDGSWRRSRSCAERRRDRSYCGRRPPGPLDRGVRGAARGGRRRVGPGPRAARGSRDRAGAGRAGGARSPPLPAEVIAAVGARRSDVARPHRREGAGDQSLPGPRPPGRAHVRRLDAGRGLPPARHRRPAFSPTRLAGAWRCRPANRPRRGPLPVLGLPLAAEAEALALLAKRRRRGRGDRPLPIRRRGARAARRPDAQRRGAPQDEAPSARARGGWRSPRGPRVGDWRTRCSHPARRWRPSERDRAGAEAESSRRWRARRPAEASAAGARCAWIRCWSGCARCCSGPHAREVRRVPIPVVRRPRAAASANRAGGRGASIGSVAHQVLEALYGSRPGRAAADPGGLGQWIERARELIAELGPKCSRGSAPTMPRRAPRRGGLVIAFLTDEARQPTPLQPAHAEASFGDARTRSPRSRWAAAACMGRSTESISALARRGAGPGLQDRRQGRRRPGDAERGKLQLQLYMLAARELWEMELAGGLYRPLGGTSKREPKGLLRKSVAEDLAALDPRPGDHLDRRGLRGGARRRRLRAEEIIAQIQRGDIGRRPDRRQLPRLLHLPADLPARARAARGGALLRRGGRRGVRPARHSSPEQPVASTPRPRRLPPRGGRHRQDHGSGRPLLRRGARSRGRRRADPRLHLHRAGRRSAPRAAVPASRSASEDRDRTGAFDLDHPRLLPAGAGLPSRRRRHRPPLSRRRRAGGRSARRPSLRLARSRSWSRQARPTPWSSRRPTAAAPCSR